MPGMVLQLAPSERVLINGAVIENGRKRARLVLHGDDLRFLRLKDAIAPQDATTPVTRLCYVLQMLVIGDRSSELRREAITGIEALSQVFDDADSRAILDQASALLATENWYGCLRACRHLIAREARLIALLAN